MSLIGEIITIAAFGKSKKHRIETTKNMHSTTPTLTLEPPNAATTTSGRAAPKPVNANKRSLGVAPPAREPAFFDIYACAAIV